MWQHTNPVAGARPALREGKGHNVRTKENGGAVNWWCSGNTAARRIRVRRCRVAQAVCSPARTWGIVGQRADRQVPDVLAVL